MLSVKRHYFPPAWQNGQPSYIKDTSPAVVGVDARWKNGAKLVKYEILKVESDQAVPTFSVKLTLEKPAAEKTVRYIIHGIDPLFVYSEEEWKTINSGKTGM